MYVLQKTDVFNEWLKRLRDKKALARIVFRMTKMEMGLLGDYKSIGDGISEIRIDYGPGYRLYFTKKNNVIIVLLIGGDKSTQSRDIAKAKILLKGEDLKND